MQSDIPPQGGGIVTKRNLPAIPAKSSADANFNGVQSDKKKNAFANRIIYPLKKVSTMNMAASSFFRCQERIVKKIILEGRKYNVQIESYVHRGLAPIGTSTQKPTTKENGKMDVSGIPVPKIQSQAKCCPVRHTSQSTTTSGNLLLYPLKAKVMSYNILSREYQLSAVMTRSADDGQLVSRGTSSKLTQKRKQVSLRLKGNTIPLTERCGSQPEKQHTEIESSSPIEKEGFEMVRTAKVTKTGKIYKSSLQSGVRMDIARSSKDLKVSSVRLHLNDTRQELQHQQQQIIGSTNNESSPVVFPDLNTPQGDVIALSAEERGIVSSSEDRIDPITSSTVQIELEVKDSSTLSDSISVQNDEIPTASKSENIETKSEPELVKPACPERCRSAYATQLLELDIKKRDTEVEIVSVQPIKQPLRKISSAKSKTPLRPKTPTPLALATDKMLTDIMKAVPSVLFEEDAFYGMVRDQCRMHGYNLLPRVIGTGSFSMVMLGRMRRDKAFKAVWSRLAEETGHYLCAMKIIDKRKAPDSVLKRFLPREIEALKKVQGHRNVVQFYQYFENQFMACIVMAFYPGDTLRTFVDDRLVANNLVTENQARVMFSQLTSAVEFCRAKGVIHRDLKCENIMLDEANCIKLGDFGFAYVVADPNQKMLLSNCGSRLYAAPELLCTDKSFYATSIDVYALGVILYKVVSGVVPYTSQKNSELIELIAKQRLHFPKHLSRELKHLIHVMLDPSPLRRPSLASIKEHAWMVGKKITIGEKNKWNNQLACGHMTTENCLPFCRSAMVCINESTKEMITLKSRQPKRAESRNPLCYASTPPLPKAIVLSRRALATNADDDKTCKFLALADNISPPTCTQSPACNRPLAPHSSLVSELRKSADLPVNMANEDNENRDRGDSDGSAGDNCKVLNENEAGSYKQISGDDRHGYEMNTQLQFPTLLGRRLAGNKKAMNMHHINPMDLFREP